MWQYWGAVEYRGQALDWCMKDAILLRPKNGLRYSIETCGLLCTALYSTNGFLRDFFSPLEMINLCNKWIAINNFIKFVILIYCTNCSYTSICLFYSLDLISLFMYCVCKETISYTGYPHLLAPFAWISRKMPIHLSSSPGASKVLSLFNATLYLTTAISHYHK